MILKINLSLDGPLYMGHVTWEPIPFHGGSNPFRLKDQVNPFVIPKAGIYLQFNIKIRAIFQSLLLLTLAAIIMFLLFTITSLQS